MNDAFSGALEALARKEVALHYEVVVAMRQAPAAAQTPKSKKQRRRASQLSLRLRLTS